MAGSNKETTRQKMIGLMYIVLVAMLALQVSNTVLDKFLLIDESLQHSVSSIRKENLRVFEGIKRSVKDRGNKPEDLDVVKKAKDVMSETDVVINEIENLRNEIVEITGGLDENDHYKGIEEDEKVMQITLGKGDSKDGKAYELKRLLNAYAEKISKFDSSLNIPNIALDAIEIDRFKNDKDQKNKDFAELNFEETPMIAAMAVLSQFENEVVRIEAKALDVLADKVGLEEVPFDQVEAFVSPVSKVVTAGTPYKATVMLVASSSVAKPKITTSEGTVDIGLDGKGSVEFVANSSNFGQDGKITKTWSGAIEINTPAGPKTYEFTEEFVVQKPNLQFESAAIQALYYNCGNELNVRVPELGIHYNPEFKITGAEYEKGNQPGKVTVIPKSKSVEVMVKNNGVEIGKQQFRVKPIPLPTLKIFNGNRPIDPVKGGALPRRIKAVAIPDADFKEFNPRDARYKVTDWELMIVRNNRNVFSDRFSNDEVNLRKFHEKAKTGDQLVMQIHKVERLNYKSDREEVKMGLQVFYYPIN
ncbi:gliding motility protein GldM [Flexithrix dorotheae]|uniref:type IX secretion system motor protein PorM/GldM n=1 Tax=Flexithrix dorotheae TaxID=70993 RepID=UPI00036317A2|nr:gliding motility protein GldM [Flexithrix dorotheae]